MCIIATIIVSTSNNLFIIGTKLPLASLSSESSSAGCDSLIYQNHPGRCLSLAVLSILHFYRFPLSFATEHMSTKKSARIFWVLVIPNLLPFYSGNLLPPL